MNEQIRLIQKVQKLANALRRSLVARRGSRTAMKNLRFALRQLLKNPGFTAVAEGGERADVSATPIS